MKAATLKAPFPAFGGKGKVAPLVWSRLGDVANYIEPFAFSAAMLLRRPSPPRIETINDANAFVSNFWRAMKADPGAVADAADWPVIEADLHARHRWLVGSDEAQGLLARVKADPEFSDAKIAGWWAWGACCWIGSGWCELRADGEVSEAMPSAEWCVGGGKGVNGAGSFSRASEAHRPQLADQFARGRGVHGNDAAGTCAQRRAWLVDWFARLADRLRVVRVCCGDWLRVCDSHSVTTRLGTTGVFLDPPYAHDTARMRGWVAHLDDGAPEPPPAGKATSRSAHLYANDRSQDVDHLVARVHRYCRERGPDPLMRIALAGYSGEHEELESLGWECVPWKSSGGYANRNIDGNDNAARERVWFSPACLKPERDRQPLFAGLADP